MALMMDNYPQKSCGAFMTNDEMDRLTEGLDAKAKVRALCLYRRHRPLSRHPLPAHLQRPPAQA